MPLSTPHKHSHLFLLLTILLSRFTDFPAVRKSRQLIATMANMHISQKERDKSYYFISHICLTQSGLIVVQGNPNKTVSFGDIVSFNPRLKRSHADIPRFSNYNIGSISPASPNVPKKLTTGEINSLIAASGHPNTLLTATDTLAVNQQAANTLTTVSWNQTLTSIHSYAIGLTAGATLTIPVGAATPAVHLDVAFKFDEDSQYASEISEGVIINWANPPAITPAQQNWIDQHLSRHFTWGFVTSVYYAKDIHEHSGNKQQYQWSATAAVTPSTQARLSAAANGNYQITANTSGNRKNAIAAYQITPIYSNSTRNDLASSFFRHHDEEGPAVILPTGNVGMGHTLPSTALRAGASDWSELHP